ncbi:MAG: tetratricopeptide repeat protein, partial [Bdellovibrionales bacterium]
KSEEVLTKELLDLDPQILIERKVSPYTYKLSEGSISYLCEDLDLKLKSTKYKTSVIALCAIVNKDYSKASSLLKRDRNSEYAVTLYSFVSRLEKDILRADEQLIKAMEFSENENFTKFFFQARFCYEKGDMKCAAEYWMKGLDRDPEAYTAHTGLALSYFQVEDYEKARTFMKRAEGFSKSYGPLIELQMLMKDVK